MSEVSNRPLFVAEEICTDSDGYNTFNMLVWPLKERRARNGDTAKTKAIQEKYGRFMPATVAVSQVRSTGGPGGRVTTIYLPKDEESCEAFCAAYREAVGIEDPTALTKPEDDDFGDLFDDLFDDDGPEGVVADFINIYANQDGDFIVEDKPDYSFTGFAINSKPTAAQREVMTKFMRCLAIACDPEDGRGTRAREFALGLAKEHHIKGMFKLANAKRAKGVDVTDIPKLVKFA